MRKSAAPSKKFISPVIRDAVTQENQCNLSINFTGVRNTTQILEILKGNAPKPKLEMRNEETIKDSCIKKLFNVVWGKKTTKKHKTWEGDGVLEVEGQSAMLKDTEGTILGRATNIKTEMIEDGYILSVGGKEVQILDLIKKSHKEKENVPQTSQNSCNKKLFNVVWGKKTTKKNKTWEGDGVLEIEGQIAMLKDIKGAILGRATNIKTEMIEDGYILSVGSKEVQIIDLITESHVVNLKRSADETVSYSSQVPSKIRKTSSVHFCPNPRGKKPKNLIMPEPSEQHQWSFNINKYPITEVSVDYCISHKLRPHQRIGIVFLYECTLGFRQENCFGAILADEMGLGKTLQCISLIWTLLRQGPYSVPIIKRCLIVTPSSLTNYWDREFTHWLGISRIQTLVIKTNKTLPKDSIENSPTRVVIISYEMFVKHAEELRKIEFGLLVCDEGHRLKNNTIKVTTLLNQLDCKRRIILTGTPIQNDLQEFYSLVDFVNPGFLGSNLEYRKYYEDPIVASREPNASLEIKELGEERAKELNQKTNNFILRRTQNILNKYLPSKTETVIFCKSSELQKQLYSATVDFWENRDIENKEIVHLNVITALKKICNHPSLLRNNINTENDSLANNLCKMFPNSPIDMTPQDSGKINVLLLLLKNLLELKEKIVIVSSYTQTLDIVAEICRCQGYTSARLDGSVPSNQRQKIVDNFNNQFSKDFIFLLSSKAGGVGLNLVGASRLVLFDSDWNPATDLQAMSRVWRDGQKKSVFLYRFLTAGTIEEKIYQRQISKTGLSGSVVDPTNTKSIKMSDEELKDLFSPDFESNCSTHTLLNCCCVGDGSIPEPQEQHSENLDERKCQLGVEKSKENDQNLKMNQLMQWEHHQQPFDGKILKELGFEDTKDKISYIFRNKCSLN